MKFTVELEFECDDDGALKLLTASSTDRRLMDDRQVLVDVLITAASYLAADEGSWTVEEESPRPPG